MRKYIRGGLIMVVTLALLVAVLVGTSAANVKVDVDSQYVLVRLNGERQEVSGAQLQIYLAQPGYAGADFYLKGLFGNLGRQQKQPWQQQKPGRRQRPGGQQQQPGGQCGPGGCPTPRIGGQPPQGGQQSPNNMVPGQTAVPSGICRIRNQMGRMASMGSGTLIEKNDRFGLVVTCQHIFREGTGKVTCVFPDGQIANADVLHTDSAWDLSALLIRAPNAEPIDVAMTAPKTGETVVSGGFGPNGKYLVNRGSVRGYVRTKATASNETLEITGRARDGDSGGPMLNSKGELVGVLWGTDGRTAGGTYCGRVDKFLLTASRYLSPYRKGVDGRLEGMQGQINGVANRPPAQIPMPQQPAPVVDFRPIETRLDRLEGRVDTQTDEIRSLKVTEATAKALVDKWPALQEALDKVKADTATANETAEAAAGASTETAEALADVTDEEGGFFSRIKARILTAKDEGIRAGLAGLAWPWGAIAGLILFLVYRDIRAKITTGDPLLVEKVAKRVRSRLGSVRKRLIPEDEEGVDA